MLLTSFRLRVMTNAELKQKTFSRSWSRGKFDKTFIIITTEFRNVTMKDQVLLGLSRSRPFPIFSLWILRIAI